MSAYRDPYERGHAWQSLNTIFSAYHRLGTFFGTEVRLFYSAALLFTFFAYMGIRPLIAMPSWTSGDTLTWVIGFPLLLLATIWCHEMGHVIAARRFRVFTRFINLSPLGGTAHLDSPAPHAHAELIIAVAGPATHALLLLIAYPMAHVASLVHAPFCWTLLADSWISINLALLVFNLLPFYPLDGGRMLRAILARFIHPNRATMITCKIGLVGAILVGLGGLGYRGTGSGLMLALAINNFMVCLRTLQEVRYSDGPYGPAREAWQEDPDAWKTGTKQASVAPSQPGLISRWRNKRHQQREQHTVAARALQEEQLDSVLARISQVGMDGLTDAERLILEHASAAAASDP